MFPSSEDDSDEVAVEQTKEDNIKEKLNDLSISDSTNSPSSGTKSDSQLVGHTQSTPERSPATATNILSPVSGTYCESSSTIFVLKKTMKLHMHCILDSNLIFV